MFGSVYWCGTYEGLPAVLLTYLSGAVLWVFDDGWRRARDSSTGAYELMRELGINDGH